MVIKSYLKPTYLCNSSDSSDSSESSDSSDSRDSSDSSDSSDRSDQKTFSKQLFFTKKKNKKCGKTRKLKSLQLKMWQNSKTQIVT